MREPALDPPEYYLSRDEACEEVQDFLMAECASRLLEWLGIEDPEARRLERDAIADWACGMDDVSARLGCERVALIVERAAEDLAWL